MEKGTILYIHHKNTKAIIINIHYLKYSPSIIINITEKYQQYSYLSTKAEKFFIELGICTVITDILSHAATHGFCDAYTVSVEPVATQVTANIKSVNQRKGIECTEDIQ